MGSSILNSYLDACGCPFEAKDSLEAIRFCHHSLSSGRMVANSEVKPRNCHFLKFRWPDHGATFRTSAARNLDYSGFGTLCIGGCKDEKHG